MNFKYLKICIFIVLFILIDNFIYLSVVRFSERHITDKRIEKILNGDIDTELIVIGSSRAARNINAAVIEEYSGISSYNLGRPGSNIDYHNFLLKLFLKSYHKPKYVLLVIDNSTIIPAPSLSFRYDLIYQFSHYPYIKNFLIERGQLNKYFSLLSRSYVVKHSFLETFKPHKFILGGNPLYSVGLDGSMNLPPNGRVVAISQKQSFYKQENESLDLLDKFLGIIELCKSNNIELRLIITPELGQAMIGFKERLQVVSGYDVPILDYRGNKKLMVQKYYNDGIHLNNLGAKELSKAIAFDLKSGIK